MLGPCPVCPVPSPCPALPLGGFEKAASQLLVILFLSFLWLFEFYFLSFFFIFLIFFLLLSMRNKAREREGGKRWKTLQLKLLWERSYLKGGTFVRWAPCPLPSPAPLPFQLLLLVDVIKISFSGHRKCHTMEYRYTPHTHTHTNSLTAK